jgi:glycosyltransferase involved in cell wall biosynthesis
MDVSVCVTTYNHGPYLRQALDGVLAQELPYDWEILIGEDDSTDGTREIVREYAARHRDRIRVFYRQAPAARMDAGRGNFLNTLNAASGRYIALLDGDDYWTSKDKLRKQVELLDRNPQCSGCFHNVQILNESLLQHRDHFTGPQPELFDIHELAAAGRNLIPTCSVVFRNGLIGKLPDWFFEIVAFGDWTLHLLHAQHGPFGYLDEVMGTYRAHGRGSWSSVDSRAQLQSMISGTKLIDRNLGYRYHRSFSRSIYLWRVRLAVVEARRRHFLPAAAHLATAFVESPNEFRKQATRTAPRALRALRALAAASRTDRRAYDPS